MIDAIIKLFDKYNIYESAFVSSFHSDFLYMLKRRNPKIIIGLIWCEWNFSYMDCNATMPIYGNYFAQKFMEVVDKIYLLSVQTWLPSFIGTNILFVDRTFISSWYVKLQSSNNRRVCAWTVNNNTEILWMRKILDIPIITDHPHLTNTIKF